MIERRKINLPMLQKTPVSVMIVTRALTESYGVVHTCQVSPMSVTLANGDL